MSPQEMRKLLDPTGKLFSGVISSNDSTSRLEKNLDVALVHDRLVLILDDTDQVWPHHLGNLIKVGIISPVILPLTLDP